MEILLKSYGNNPPYSLLSRCSAVAQTLRDGSATSKRRMISEYVVLFGFIYYFIWVRFE